MTLDRQAAGLRAAVVHRSAPRGAPWTVLAGAKGGVGKTLLAVNLGLLLARAGHRTLLADLDPGCGNVDIHLRLVPQFTLEDAFGGRCTPRQAVADGPLGLGVLASRSACQDLLHADERSLDRALQMVAEAAADFDVVVCDTGAGIGPVTLGAVERADLVVGLTAPEPAALTDAYALCKVLHLRGRPLPALCVNQARNRDEAMRTAGRLGSVCARFLGAELPLLGFVRRDPLLEASVAEQRPFALLGQGPALQDLQALCASVLSMLPPLQRRASREVRLLQGAPP